MTRASLPTNLVSTPNPWTAENQPESNEAMVMGADGRPVCYMRSWPEDWANAHLISAAPDLLAALQELVERAELASTSEYAGHIVWIGTDEMHKAIGAARTALLKAGKR